MLTSVARALFMAVVRGTRVLFLLGLRGKLPRMVLRGQIYASLSGGFFFQAWGRSPSKLMRRTSRQWCHEIKVNMYYVKINIVATYAT